MQEFSMENLIGIKEKTGIRSWGSVPVVPVGQESAECIGKGSFKILAFRDPETENIWLQMIPRNVASDKSETEPEPALQAEACNA